MTNQISVNREIAATPDELWAHVSDVQRMGEHSPETVRCEWLGDATGPTAGTRFKGTNENAAKKKRWSTIAKVTDCEPGRIFAFEVNAGPFKVSRWEYRFEPTESGCTVTETWTDRRGRLVTFMGKPVSGVADRAEHNHATMLATLDQLAANVAS